MATALRVVLIKPSKYDKKGLVERFRWGLMPNSTLSYIRSLTPERIGESVIDVIAIDEYVQTDLSYLDLLRRDPSCRTLLALVGVQSHQFQRALDLAGWAMDRGVESCIIGGPHPITCDTSMMHDRGVSFAVAEAESVWVEILHDALRGELQAVYGQGARWQEDLHPPVLQPLPLRDLRRYAVPMLGIYPARGCPFTCNFCSVIHIAGRKIRSQPVETTIASLRAAKAGGVRLVMFTSDNFNKYPQAMELIEAMIAENFQLPFFAQCDAQIYKQPELLERMARAGCFQIFVGVESFSREVLRGAHKLQNKPEHYAEIIALCRQNGITSHFSNIIGFPEDTEEAILEHLHTLREMHPDVASFYILTPIPGTEQYEDFFRDGIITEQNLDRFDGSEVTWAHPSLQPEDLQKLLSLCYRKFYSAGHVAEATARIFRRISDYRLGASMLAVVGYGVMSRLAARRLEHPMAGGTWRVRLDSAGDYADSRKHRFGFSQAPLPRSLPAGFAAD